MKKIFLALLPLLALLFTAGCLTPESPKIAYQATDVTVISPQVVQTDSHFTIKNTNPISLHGQVEYELLVRGKLFSSGYSSTIEVGANAESSFLIQSRIDILRAFGVAADLLNEIQAGKTSVPFQINGKFRSDILGIQLEAPVSASGEIPLPKLQDLLNIKIK